MAHPAPNKRTTSVVVPAKRKMIALTVADGMKGDRGVPDFIKWVENFGRNDNQSGHFLDKGKAEDFAEYLRKRFEEIGGYVDLNNAELLTTYIIVEAKAYSGWFVSFEAAEHFSLQVLNYIVNDEFIGTPPSTPETKETPIARKQSRNDRRRRKTS